MKNYFSVIISYAVLTGILIGIATSTQAVYDPLLGKKTLAVLAPAALGIAKYAHSYAQSCKIVHDMNKYLQNHPLKSINNPMEWLEADEKLENSLIDHLQIVQNNITTLGSYTDCPLIIQQLIVYPQENYKRTGNKNPRYTICTIAYKTFSKFSHEELETFEKNLFQKINENNPRIATKYPLVNNLLSLRWWKHTLLYPNYTELSQIYWQLIKQYVRLKALKVVINTIRDPGADPLPLKTREAIMSAFQDFDKFDLLDEISKCQFVTSQNYFMRGKRTPPADVIKTLQSFLHIKNQKRVIPRFLQNAVLQLTYKYKIHLMPTQDTILPVFIKLLQKIKDDSELQNKIAMFKIFYNLEEYYSQPFSTLSNEEVFPVIIIYPADGKENAQKVLDTMIELFRGTEGMNITPRFNQKVTSLIYFAQGDGDSKKDPRLKDAFEQPHQIYYQSDLSGSHQNYRLTFPESKEDPE